MLSKNRMSQVRREIGIIADRSYSDHLINDEAYKGYRELAEGREAHQMSADMLESTRSFAKEHESKAVRVHEKIQAAMRAGYASQADEEFLMEKLVTDNIQFANKADQVEGLIEEKLDRMKKDKETYNQLASHTLIKNIGYLKVDATTKINFPDEKDFLNLTVPERREVINKIQAALPKAEQYASQTEEIEDGKLKEGYRKKLDDAQKKGIIGKLTHQKFMDGFQKVDHEEKQYWTAEFDAQMERYQELWNQIRSELQGPALKEIEGKIDQLGYSEIFTEFGRLKNTESKRLSDDYAFDLESYRQQGVIGRHTVAQFMVWMNQQELSDKYQAASKLPAEMNRYEKLWEDISKLNKKEQAQLHSKIDIWGYTELSQAYGQLSGQTNGVSGQMEDGTQILSLINSKEVKDAIVETDEMLTKQGTGKRKSFGNILEKMFNRASRDSFDATSFETEVREKVSANNPHIKEDPKGRGANDEVDFSQIEEDAEILEENGKAKVIQDTGFLQIESKDSKGGLQRDIQVTINEEDGMKRFLSENSKNHFETENDGGSDDLSLAIQTDSGRTVELDLQEIRVLKKYLEKSEEKEQNDKAA